MQIFFGLLLFLLAFFTLVGDIVLKIGKACIEVLLICFFILKMYVIGLIKELLYGCHLGNNVLQKTRAFLKRTIKKHKKLKEKHSFTSTLLLKVKYFVLGGFFFSCFIIIPVLFILLADNLPNPAQLIFEDSPQTTKIYDRNHTLLYEIYATQNRTIVPLTQIPQYLQEATIAIEDKNFYSNPGFDIAAIIRAAIADITGKELQGGSTITQQLIKVTLLTPKISFLRKAEEIILAVWTEKIYTKKQILQMYFNQVPYGGTAWGIEAAAEVYFNKSVQQLDLAECAFLAGIPRAPSLYSPFSDYPDLWKQRQKDVLSRMQELGYITKQEKEQATTEQLTFQPPKQPFEAPHFVMYVKNLLIEKYGLSAVEKGGLAVITSLDSSTQNTVQKIVADEVTKDAYLNISNGAAVIANPKNGDILAMIGSKDYNSPDGGTVNLATAHRQPGSSIKLVTYSAALSHGFTAATVINDSPVTFTNPYGQSYSPVNYDGRFHGNVTVRTALANSLNIPAVKVLNTIGIPTFVSLGKQMGISSLQDPNNYGLSITLGAADVTMLDMTQAFSVLANSGNRVDLNPFLKVTDAKGNILEEKTDNDGQRVLDPGVTFIMSNILADNNARSMEFGSNSPLYIPDHTVSVKTGTSDDKRDNWTDGYTPSYVVVTWVGNNDNSPMNPALASGITGAAPIWHEIMTNLLKNKPDEKPSRPADIIEKTCNGKTEYFIAGTENLPGCGTQPSQTFPFKNPF